LANQVYLSAEKKYADIINALSLVGKYIFTFRTNNEPKSTVAHVRVERPKPTTLIKKEKKIFLIYSIRKFRGIGCKVIYDKRPPHVWGKFAHFLLY
jgi:hypothetical protein